MIDINLFDKFVINHFGFLQKEKGYDNIRVADTNRIHGIHFYKGVQSFRIKYSFANNFIEVSFWPIEDSYYTSKMLFSAMRKRNPNFDFETDYTSIMPSHISLESSIEKLATLLKEHYDEMVKQPL